MEDNKIAKVDNFFVLNAHYKMSAREQKFLYYLISLLDPKNEKDFRTLTVPIIDVGKAIKDSGIRSGSIYDDIEKMCDTLISKRIVFQTDVVVENKVLKGRINIFSSIMPLKNSYGEKMISFSFSPEMKPFLLQLNQYVKIGLLEVVPMKNAHAIRMYSIFKSEKDRLSGIKKEIKITYKLEDLKSLLGIIDEYSDNNLQNFKVRVLNKIKEEINENSKTMKVDYVYVKPVRKVTGVTFIVSDPNLSENNTKKGQKKTDNNLDLTNLSKAQLKAFEILVNYGIKDDIALKQMILKLQGSEIVGYEDIFIQKAIKYFESHANVKNEKVLYSWWVKNKSFEIGTLAWTSIIENVISHKKSLEKEDSEAYDNREVAKTMTASDFNKWYSKNKQNNGK